MKIGTTVHESNGMKVVIGGGALCGFTYIIVDAAGRDIAIFEFKSEAVHAIEYGAAYRAKFGDTFRDRYDDEDAAEDELDAVQDEINASIDAACQDGAIDPHAGEVANEFNFGFDGMAFYANDGSDVCGECNGSRGQHTLDCNAIN